MNKEQQNIYGEFPPKRKSCITCTHGYIDEDCTAKNPPIKCEVNWCDKRKHSEWIWDEA